MGRIKKWKSRTKTQAINCPHNARPLTQAIESYVESGAVRVEVQKERWSNRWHLEALYFEEEE